MERHALRCWGWHSELIPGRATKLLVAVVMAWWLLIVGAVTCMLPSLTGVDGAAVFAAGHSARVSTPSGSAWLIPIERVTYYEVDRPSMDDAEDVMVDVPARPGWLAVLNGQTVRVVDVDREAVQVELLEEPNIGGQGWLHLRYLRP